VSSAPWPTCLVHLRDKEAKLHQGEYSLVPRGKAKQRSKASKPSEQLSPVASSESVQPAPFSPNWVNRLSVYLTSDYFLVLAALLISLIGLIFGEKIKYGGGFGMDGYFYGTWARDFFSSIFVGGVDLYYIQRILPSAVVHYSLRLLHLPLTNRNIITAFGILNVIAITCSAYVWCLIANKLAISRQGKLFGFMALFLNFALMKWPSYYPVLTDVLGFFIGLLMIYFYLLDKKIGLFILMGLGAFVWPMLIYQGALLLMFPRDEVRDKTCTSAPYGLNIVAGAAVALGVLVYLAWLALHTDLTMTRIPPMTSLVHLSIAISVLYLFFGFVVLLDCDKLFDFKHLFGYVKRWTFFAAIIFFFAIKWLQGSLANGPSLRSFSEELYLIASANLAKPAIFYVAHVMFFGPIIILALFFWKSASKIMHQHGLGLTLCLAFGLLLSLNSQSRQLISFFPLLVTFVVKGIDDISWRPYHLFLFASVSVVLSKVWLLISGAPIDLDETKFSEQLFYMNVGPWMSDYMYSIQGTAVLIAGVLLYLLYVKHTKRTITLSLANQS
jgi:hypothetical protein